MSMLKGILFCLFVVLALANVKHGLEPPLKHPRPRKPGHAHLKYCKANTTCPPGHVPFDAVYLEAYVRTRYNDPYTGYYSLVSKKLNKYGQFTLTNKTSEAVIVHVDIGNLVDGFTNAGSITTYNADFPSLNHIGAVLGYGSNDSYIRFEGYNYYSLSPTTVTPKLSKPVSKGYSAYAYFTGINAPKESSIWSIVYHQFGAAGHIFPIWYNPTFGKETYNSLYWFPKENALFGISNYVVVSEHFHKKYGRDLFYAVRVHFVYNFY
ncbi:uncharacterized protein EI90DRAFT_1467453 [Cantharellus anzutake]|uniref:uncharacterized protein n=1 Tax=Cantharellus anzutake TaxID=1750568 RepID=UPI0019054282|nr:uncharacterized protein EI90DRAFT_1467453 [Cantharellus anzutake]KAF8309614.1 hypothetical protein EI90DRAFT_1467453 [Cantharellus anzutake]